METRSSTGVASRGCWGRSPWAVDASHARVYGLPGLHALALALVSREPRTPQRANQAHGRELDVLDRRKGRGKGTQKSLFLTYIGRLFGSIKCTLNRDISQINFFLSLVNVKRELFSPLVIVGSQIFERPSGGRYGGRWISDRYLKSNIYQIFGVQKSIGRETGSKPRPHIIAGKPCR